MKPIEDCTTANYHDFLDFEIVDKNNEAVGALFTAWSDQKTGKFEFLGFKTGWLVGENRILPAKGAQVDEENRRIHVPYTAEFLKDAPPFDAAAEVTEEHEQEIRDYYRGDD